MKVLINGAPITDVTPGGAPIYVPGFATTPAARQNAVHGMPGRMLQIQADGVDIGNANPAVINVVADPGLLLVTRGAGEQSNVVTVRKLATNPDPTILLLHGDDADGSTSFIDHSGYSRTVTAVGLVAVRTDTSVFGPTSIRFINTEFSYLRVEDVRLLNLFDYDCTISFWAYQSDNLNQWFISSYENTAANGWGIFRIVDGANPNGALAFGDGFNARIKSADGSLPINTWHHIAVTTLNRVTSLWLNGALVGSLTISNVSSIKNSGHLYLGIQANGGSFGNGLRGYMQEIVLLQGEARYTAPFAPPTAPNADLPAKPAFADRTDLTSVQIATHFNGINGGTLLVSQGSGFAKLMTNSGVVISTAQSKFGGSSGYFDGAAYCATPAGGNFAVDTWTARCWVMVTENKDDFTLFSGNEGAIFDNFYLKRVAGSWIVGNGSVDPIVFADAAFNLNQWYYIEAVHSGSTYYLFKGGVLIASATATPSNTALSQMRIGGQVSSSLFLTGYVQDAEFILGASTIPRTSNYAVPTTDFIPHNVWPPSP